MHLPVDEPSSVHRTWRFEMTGSPGGRDVEGLRQTCQDAGRGWPGPAFVSTSRTGRWLVVPPQLGATFQGLSRIGANAKPTIARLRHRRRSVRCTPDAGMDDAVPVPPPMEAGRKEKKKGPLWIGSLLRIRLRYFGELNAVQAQRLRRPLKDSDQRSGTDGSGQNTHKRVLPVEKGDVERWGHAQTDSQMLHACSSARWW